MNFDVGMEKDYLVGREKKWKKIGNTKWIKWGWKLEVGMELSGIKKKMDIKVDKMGMEKGNGKKLEMKAG